MNVNQPQAARDIRDTPGFLWKKWLLFSFCLIVILITIIMAALAGKIVDDYVEDYYHDSTHISGNVDLDAVKTGIKVFVWILAAISILFNLIGLMGAYKEHYCMTVTYAVLMTLATLTSIGTAVNAPTYWANFVFYLIVTILSYAFAYDLHKRRRLLFANPTPIIIQTQPAAPAYGQHPYGQPYGQAESGQPGGGQQQQQQQYGKQYS